MNQGDLLVDGADRRRAHRDTAGRAGVRASILKIAHASLKSGDPCPECLKGKVYEQKEQALRIRVVGQAPLAATVYELERLRCNLCGKFLKLLRPPAWARRSTMREQRR